MLWALAGGSVVVHRPQRGEAQVGGEAGVAFLDAARPLQVRLRLVRGMVA